ncbi:hypothetical protein BKK79_10905 [Cupriavidus sp. USMAA2-4]|uniref:hypothetical protein n=1 Tax=Cupriavidus sp. USMAA2-4 TaxID=876364 RepID=UPI0008A67804|nr:hypothetical protein [Cupriavidus sp. USMAA2-4]AOY92229.1 hypothetical protein BKK79_10905 [Cupriavidus sp. USMAA2-4]
MDRKYFVILAGAALVSACASTVVEQRAFKSYAVGREVSTTTGSVMLVDQNGYITKRRVWVGLLNSPDGWRELEQPSADYIRKELIYSGIAGTTIELSYREFRQGYAAPAFYQSVRYDLAQSRTVRFQNFTVDILSADNQRIRYRIASDR